MPKYTVDVKAFINLTVEAPDADSARLAADRYVEESCSPSFLETRAWMDAVVADGEAAYVTDASGGFSVDSYSEVEEAD